MIVSPARLPLANRTWPRSRRTFKIKMNITRPCRFKKSFSHCCKNITLRLTSGMFWNDDWEILNQTNTPARQSPKTTNTPHANRPGGAVINSSGRKRRKPREHVPNGIHRPRGAGVSTHAGNQRRRSFDHHHRRNGRHRTWHHPTSAPPGRFAFFVSRGSGLPPRANYAGSSGAKRPDWAGVNARSNPSS